jgi:hypothetical protein
MARATGGSNRPGMGTRRPDGKAATGEGRHVGEDQQRVGSAVDAPAVVACVRQWGKEMLLCFFFLRNRVVRGAEEVCWAQSLGWPGNELSGQNTPGYHLSYCSKL